jgi:hypothetical protein
MLLSIHADVIRVMALHWFVVEGVGLDLGIDHGVSEHRSVVVGHRMEEGLGNRRVAIAARSDVPESVLSSARTRSASPSA